MLAEIEEPKSYIIRPAYKKSTYQTEQWDHKLKNGKAVRLLITTYFYWGDFEIELTDNEKEKILEKDTIVINDYVGTTCIELDSGCDRTEEIENENSYTEQEKREINCLMFYSQTNEEEYNSEDEYCLDECLLEENGWMLNDTIYGFDCNCELELNE
jgi:hypothetical protein